MKLGPCQKHGIEEIISDEQLIAIAKDQQTYLNTFADGPVLRFGRAVEAIVSLRYEEMMSELEREIRMVRERVKRLEKENSWLEEENVLIMQNKPMTP